MGVDFPDFQQTAITNLVLQEIAELTVRPKYGAGQVVYSGTLVLAGKTTSVFSISGKGVTYGGAIANVYGAGQWNSKVYLYLDGNLFDADRYGYLNASGIYKPFMRGIFLVRYDTTYLYYEVYVSPGITFETSLEVKYENDASDVTVNYDMHYALI